METFDDRHKYLDEQTDKKPLIEVTRTISQSRFFVVARESEKGAQIEREIYRMLQGGMDSYELFVSVTKRKWKPIRALRQCLARLVKGVLHCIG